MWNPDFAAGETVTWTAGCGGGLATGSGTLKWVRDGGELNGTGMQSNGMYIGQWVLRIDNGTVGEGPFVDGERNGHWVFRYADGTVEDIQHVNGEIVSRERR